MTRKLHLLRKFFSDKDGKLVIWQFPNVPLWAWVLFTILSRLLSHGRPHTIAHDLSVVAIIVWAGLEVYSGASYFRRTLGAVVLILTGLALFK